jgi:hypothetical protein
MKNLFSSAALGWFLRRIPDWGGWVGTLFVGLIELWERLPPSSQDAIQRVLGGAWEEITIGSIIPLGALVWSQLMSYKATVRDQVVVDGQKVTDKDLSETKQREVKKVVAPAIEKKSEPNIFERIFFRDR